MINQQVFFELELQKEKQSHVKFFFLRFINY